MKTTAPDIMSDIGLNFLPISDIHGILVDFLYRILWRNRTAKTGQPEQDRTASRGQQAQDRQNLPGRKGTSGNGTVRKRLHGQHSQNMTARKGQPEQDSQ
jgi:hypothetical protein